MSQHLAVMRGALDRDEAGDRTAETHDMVDEGTTLVASISAATSTRRSRVTTSTPRANKQWLRKGAKLADALVSSASGLPWEPDDTSTAHLGQSGQRVTGVVIDVQRDGMGNERRRRPRDEGGHPNRRRLDPRAHPQPLDRGR